MRLSTCLSFPIVGALIVSFAFSQEPHRIVGTVIDESGNPLPNVSLRLSNIGSAVSDDNGEFFFTLPSDIDPGSEVEFVLNKVVVIKRDTMVIFEPPRGIYNVPKNPLQHRIKIVLLPQGDHRLLSKDGLKLLIIRITQKDAQQQLQLQATVFKLEQQLTTKDLQDPLDSEAKRLGFSKEELIAALEKVKEQLQNSDNPYEVGLAALYDKKSSKAVEYIKKSIQQDEKAIQKTERLKEELPEKWLNLGNAMGLQLNFKEMAFAYQKAVELRPDYWDAYARLGATLLMMGDVKGVRKIFQRGLSSIKTQRLYKMTPQEANSLVEFFISFKFVISQIGERPDSVLFYSHHALNILRKVSYSELIQNQAAILSSIAKLFQNIGEPDSAKIYFQRALTINHDAGNRQSEANQLNELGNVFMDLNQIDSAYVYHQAALKIQREISNRKGEAEQLFSLGKTFLGLKLPDSAKAYFKSARKVYYELGNESNEAEQLVFLAWLFFGLGQKDSALAYFQTARKIHRDSGNRIREVSLVAKYASMTGMLDIQSAGVYILQAHSMVGEIRPELPSFFRITMQLMVGYYYMSKSKIDSAYFYYNLALNESKRFSNTVGEIMALAALSYLFHEVEFRYDDAFEINKHRIQFDSLNTSILADFAENHFTTSRFAECEKRIATLIDDPVVDVNTGLGLFAIRLANQIALKNSQAISNIPDRLTALIDGLSKVSNTFKIRWIFAGTKHFINQNKVPFEPYQDWLLEFFEAFEGQNRDAIIAGLKKSVADFHSITDKK